MGRCADTGNLGPGSEKVSLHGDLHPGHLLSTQSSPEATPDWIPAFEDWNFCKRFILRRLVSAGFYSQHLHPTTSTKELVARLQHSFFAHRRQYCLFSARLPWYPMLNALV